MPVYWTASRSIQYRMSRGDHGPLWETRRDETVMKLMSDEGCPDRSMRVRSALGMLERI